MKKNVMYLCLLVFAMGVWNSCGDDEESKEHLLGTWSLKPDAMDMIWESSEEMSISGVSMRTQAIAALIKQYGNASLPNTLKSITFKDDNKLEATYIDDGVEKTDVYGTYRVVNDHKLSFKPDVEKLLDGEEISSEAMTAIKVLLATGIPVYYDLSGEVVSGYFYLDTQTIKEIKNLLPLLAASMSGDDADDLLIKELLEQMPGVLDKTEKIELGLNFTKGTN